MSKKAHRLLELLEPDEREHCLRCLSAWAADPVTWPGDLAAETLKGEVIQPLNEWLKSKGRTARTDIQAATAFVMYAEDIAERLQGGLIVLPEQLSHLDHLWKEFQLAVGHGQTLLRQRERSMQRTWQTAGGKARKGKLSPFKHAIQALAKELRTRDANVILSELRADAADASDLLDDLRARRNSPVTLRFHDVPADATDNAEKVFFSHTDTGKEEERTIKTLKNCIR